METVEIAGRPTRVWKNAPPSLRAVLALIQPFGERTFLVHEDERVSYDAFQRAVAALATQLRQDGVEPGDRVAIIMRNLPEWVVAFFAATALGAIAAPLNAWWTGAELEFALSDSGAKVALADGERFARFADHLEALPELKVVYVSRSTEPSHEPRVRDLEGVVGPPSNWADLPAAALPPAEVAPDDPATLFYTSGTTGKPKGAVGTQRNILSNVMASAFSGARFYVRRGEAPPQPDPSAPQRVLLMSIPFFHVTGCFAALLPAMLQGGKVVMTRRWDPVEAFRLIERERVTNAGGVPTIAWQLIEHPERENFDLSSLELVSYGGAPASPELVKRITEAFPASQPGSGWGMTETSATFTHHLGEDYQNRPGSAGPAVPVCDMRIVSDDGRDLPTGEVGELLVRGPNVIAGYWNRPEANASTFVDGWLKTGDLARLDEEGFLFIVDRKKDMLIRGGENIYCIEVEDALYDHPAVMDAAVIGLPHPQLGEEPAAVVTLKPGMAASEGELREHVAARLAAYKVPVRVVIRDETLPRNANGKIVKPELKPLFA
ncbi:MAG: AMP-binding protein [Caulobacteraceae bacterium]|nr:AMP-binding protein [Caulobacter sp.]